MTARATPNDTPQSLPRLPRWIWLAIGLACAVPAVLDGVETYLRSHYVEHNRASWPNIIFQSSEWLFLGALTPIAYFMSRRVPLRRPHLVRNTFIHMSGALLLCIGWAGLGVTARKVLGISWGPTVWPELASWTLISL